MELRRGDAQAAHRQFSTALALSRNAMERRYLEKRIEKCLSL
jgi:predicted RNA polymerase sigma factor